MNPQMRQTSLLLHSQSARSSKYNTACGLSCTSKIGRSFDRHRQSADTRHANHMYSAALALCFHINVSYQPLYWQYISIHNALQCFACSTHVHPCSNVKQGLSHIPQMSRGAVKAAWNTCETLHHMRDAAACPTWANSVTSLSFRTCSTVMCRGMCQPGHNVQSQWLPSCCAMMLFAAAIKTGQHAGVVWWLLR